jgi:16S rRNA (cytidine1402-2'-O)-methyltransferase
VSRGDAGGGAASGGGGSTGGGSSRAGGAASGGGPTGDAAAAAGGILYVVATPIGNLSDVTLRALEVLAAVPLIAAEDTRLSKRLLERHGVSARMASFHARSGPGRLASLLDHLRGGADLALVTDAGTPAVSDPGADLVAAWAGEGGRVVPIPGASAVLAAVAASGVTGPRWSFEGFLPRSGRDRKDRLAAIAADDRGSVLFEAPGRVAATLRDLAAACGAGRAGAVCRELTKLHEQIVRGSLGDLVAAVTDGAIPSRGEFVLVIGMRNEGDVAPEASAQAASATQDALTAAIAQVQELVDTGTPRGEAAKRVAAATGLPRRRLYEVAEGS